MNETYKEMISGLKKIQEAELDLYSTNIFISTLEDKKKEVLNPCIKEMYKPKKKKILNIFDIIIGFSTVGGLIGGGYAWCFTDIPGTFIIKLIKGIIPVLKFGGIGVLAGLVLGIIYIVIAKSKNEILFKKELVEAKQINERNLNHNKKIKTLSENKAKTISNMINDIYKIRAKLSVTIDQLYRKMGIYKNYQTLPAVCAFIEYLESGRCTTLTGPFGCYNKFDEDLKHGEVILKLDQISSKLDEMLHVQKRMAYSLEKIEKETNRIANICYEQLKSLSEMSEIIDNISENTKYIEFYNHMSMSLQMYQSFTDKK